jgi:hypothetical protein
MRLAKRKPQMSEFEIKYVQSFAPNFDQIIEFGSGISTLKWAEKFSNVISIETRAEWFNKIRLITMAKHKNVRMVFSPPDSSAYNEEGEEQWVIRVPSDYGLEHEFAGYLRTAQRIIESQTVPCVIFIDANMRSEILEIAINSEISHEILVHDVIPERDYLNLWKIKYAENIVNQIDSLVHVKQI